MGPQLAFQASAGGLLVVMPKPTPSAKAFFEEVFPRTPSIEVKPMFGNLGAFHKGNMFGGIFGDAVFIRLPDGDREKFMEDFGVGLFEPMKGRPMGEYVNLPAAWRSDPKKARAWVARAMAYVDTLPAKRAKGRPSRPKKK